jgi:predicted S18 family serine protease
VFTSQRSERLTEEGIYYWFRTLKAQGSRNQRAVIEDLSFYDLRQDFAQRARAARWLPEEVAYYLGQAAQQGITALQSIVPSTPKRQEGP